MSWWPVLKEAHQEEDTEAGVSKPKLTTSFTHFLKKSSLSPSCVPDTVLGCRGTIGRNPCPHGADIPNFPSLSFPAVKKALQDIVRQLNRKREGARYERGLTVTMDEPDLNSNMDHLRSTAR